MRARCLSLLLLAGLLVLPLVGCTGRYIPLSGARPGPEACSPWCERPCAGPMRLPPPKPCVPCPPVCRPACPPPVPVCPPPVPACPPPVASSTPVVQIHAVSDIVERMPTVQLVGPDEVRNEPRIESLILYLHQQVPAAGTGDVEIRAQGDHALVVKAAPARHAEIHQALERLRSQMAAEAGTVRGGA